jgi:ElaB/YqjD/DUF883 family membrane-anchored ribosome-binding protein
MDNPADQIQKQVADLKEAYEQERESTLALARAAVDTSKQAVDFADQWVRYNAWKLLGVSLALGLVLGALLARRQTKPDLDGVPR